jgi:hypothetical protein
MEEVEEELASEEAQDDGEGGEDAVAVGGDGQE